MARVVWGFLIVGCVYGLVGGDQVLLELTGIHDG